MVSRQDRGPSCWARERFKTPHPGAGSRCLSPALVLANFKDKDVDTCRPLMEAGWVNIPQLVTPPAGWCSVSLLAHLQEEHTAFTAAKETAKHDDQAYFSAPAGCAQPEPAGWLRQHLNSTSSAASGPQRYSTVFYDVFDTVTQVIAYRDSEEEFTAQMDALHADLVEYNQLYDIYNDYDGVTNIKTINFVGIAPVTVNDSAPGYHRRAGPDHVHSGSWAV